MTPQTHKSNSLEALPLELKAHIYQKLEEIKNYLVPGIELNVKINPEAKEGFSIQYEIKTEGFEVESNASGDNPYDVTSEATDSMITKLGNVQNQIIQYLEDNNLIQNDQRLLH